MLEYILGTQMRASPPTKKISDRERGDPVKVFPLKFAAKRTRRQEDVTGRARC